MILMLKLIIVKINLKMIRTQIEKGDKYQESIQSRTHLTQDSTWESDKTQLNITNESQEVSPFPAGDHKVAMN